MTILAVSLAAVILAAGTLVPVLLTRGGRARSARVESPSSGWEYVALGALSSAGGGGLLLLDDPPVVVAVPLLWLGGVLTAVGAIAIGITLGTERTRWRHAARTPPSTR